MVLHARDHHHERRHGSERRPVRTGGNVEDAQRHGSIHHEFANLQAWFNPDAGALMFWEVDLWRGREEDPAQDFLSACLWDDFELELLRLFPDAQEIITPHEPNYDSRSWAAFLIGRPRLTNISFLFFAAPEAFF
jgi:hypothetical protein